jgi:hypothetical protein
MLPLPKPRQRRWWLMVWPSSLLDRWRSRSLPRSGGTLCGQNPRRGFSVFMMRAASVVVAITNSSKRQFVATDDALQAAHIGAEEDKEALQGPISHVFK